MDNFLAYILNFQANIKVCFYSVTFGNIGITGKVLYYMWSLQSKYTFLLFMCWKVDNARDYLVACLLCD